jgi:N-dimethylarginine dimethylaminohydrolase
MCPPEHFEVSYVINPWMTPDDWQEHRVDYTALSAAGWEELKATLEKLGAEIDLIAPAAGLPDLVFTANAAVVMDGKALVATFKNRERQGEEPLYFAYFKQLQSQGRLTKVEMTPPDVILEGAGDCVWDEKRNLFWMGYGQRSDPAAQKVLEDFFGLDRRRNRLPPGRVFAGGAGADRSPRRQGKPAGRAAGRCRAPVGQPREYRQGYRAVRGIG